MRSMAEGDVPNPLPPAGADGLTARQARVMRAIRESIRARGYPPSLQEIGAAAGLTSTSSVSHHLEVLRSRGLLRNAANRARSYVPADLVQQAAVSVQQPGMPEAGVARVPLVDVARNGGAAAGELVLEVLELPRQLVGDGEVFAAVVTGPMEAAGVLDQDMVVVQRHGPVHSGDLVAVLLEGEVVVRRLRRDGAHAWLLAGTDSEQRLWCDEAALLPGRCRAALLVARAGVDPARHRLASAARKLMAPSRQTRGPYPGQGLVAGAR